MIARLFRGLVLPVFVAILQLALTPSLLPPMLVYGSGNTEGLLVEGKMVGFVLLLLLLLITMARLIWLIQAAPTGSVHRNFCFTLLAIGLSIPVGMITENIWTHTPLFLYEWAFVAIAGWDWDEERSPTSLVASPTLPPNPHPIYFS